MMKLISKNKRVNFDYVIENVIECGVVLLGDEVKSIRMNKTSITEAHITFQHNEAFIVNWSIPQYKSSYQVHNTSIYNATRIRKLLLHKNEINRLAGCIATKGKTCIPLECYSNKKGIIKLKIAIATGKKTYDKREYIKAKDRRREAKQNFIS